MTVGSAQVAATSSWGASQDKDGKISVTVPYYVTSNDLADGPLTVLGATGLPAINSTLSAGNDSNALLFCQGRTPSKVDDKSGQWIVSCKFATDEEKQDKDGEPTDDPEQWQPTLQVTSVGYATPITQDAVWVAKANQVVPGRENDEKGPIINSAGKIIYPIPMKDDVRQQIRFTRYYIFFDGDIFKDYVPSINMDVFSIKKWHNGEIVFDYPITKGQLKISSMNIVMELHTVNDVLRMFNKVTLVCDIKKDGWNHKEIDRGTHSKSVGGDPDGKCGESLELQQPGVTPVIPPGDPGGPACEGVAPHRVAIGNDGLPAGEVNLNGFGFPLHNVNQSTTLEYRIHQERILGFLFEL